MKIGIRLVLWLLVVGALGITLNSAYRTYQASQARNDVADVTTRSMGLVKQPPKHLAAQFTDVGNRMLADPVSADKSRDPATIVLAHVVASDTDKIGLDWEKFEAHIAAVTGRKVIDRSFDNNPEDLDAIKDGKISVVVVHAPEAPFLVNNYGFQPFAVVGDESGAIGNHLDIIVAPNSEISHPGDLKKHALVCTTPSSITGYRAAVTLLLHNEGLRPNVDYDVTWSVSQKKSIKGVIAHKFNSAAVSDEKLQSMLADGDIKESQYKVIYSSEVIPRATIGCFYDLKPELAAKIQQAIISFKSEKMTSADAGEDSQGDAADAVKHVRFIPVDYKRDFKLVREIDDSFDPRVGAKPPKSHAASPATQK
ncbi:MAG TPA: PhnD/SsuA/transferrin family substrate-binding protein [Tepidisphaeraceae bacterium]|jgi:phosphonate transport system substrate-binding protein|nr:PhnD/SsuA/transferrin family substrate-binding protein [Tepidisphaeraceae bacterium]